MSDGSLTVLPVRGLPEVAPGDDLAALITGHVTLEDGDVLVVAQKIVSKAEGAIVALPPDEDEATARRRLARELARRVVAEAPWALVVETRHGLVCANAGIDASNVPGDALVLLPEDPDRSARLVRARLHELTGVTVAVVISDTFGRPWRLGQTDVAIGLAGLTGLRDERGGVDRHGKPLAVTEAAVADELAGAADLVRGKADGVPAVVVRGFAATVDDEATARDLVRPSGLDLFRHGRGGVTAALGMPSGKVLRPVDEHDLQLAVAAARRVAGDGLEVTTGADTKGTIVTVGGSSGLSPLAVGLGAGTLVASLTDLGCEVSVEAHGDHSARVRAGRT